MHLLVILLCTNIFELKENMRKNNVKGAGMGFSFGVLRACVLVTLCLSLCVLVIFKGGWRKEEQRKIREG